MERGSSKHGAREDDALKSELQGTLQGNRSSRAEEWRDPKEDPHVAIDSARKKPSIAKHIDLQVDPDAPAGAHADPRPPRPRPRK